MKKENIDMYFDLFEKGIVPEIYSAISYLHNNEILCKSNNHKRLLKKGRAIYFVKDIPSYLNTKLKKRFKTLKLHQYKGYAIYLDKFPDADTFLKTKIKPRHRTMVRSHLSRLELCFNISYRMFYGKITADEYDSLLASLHKFMERRFKQRNRVNKRLLEWDRIHKLFFSLINEKKASLFVIYDGDRPIDISLNFHYDKIFFNAIASYDIDYAKFGLGHVIIYKQIDWCIKNSYKIFDTGMGDLEYKQKWFTDIYDFENHIVYDKNDLEKNALAHTMAKLYELKAFLKKKNVHVLYYKVRGLFKKKAQNDDGFMERLYEMVNIEEVPSNENIAKIDIHTDEYAFLRKPTYEFQYSNIEPSTNISVYKTINCKNSYIIEGKEKKQKVIFKY